MRYQAALRPDTNRLDSTAVSRGTLIALVPNCRKTLIHDPTCRKTVHPTPVCSRRAIGRSPFFGRQHRTRKIPARASNLVSHAQMCVDQLVGEFLDGPGRNAAAFLHQSEFARNAPREAQVLLDQKQGDARILVEREQHIADLVD